MIISLLFQKVYFMKQQWRSWMIAVGICSMILVQGDAGKRGVSADGKDLWEMGR